MAPADTKIKRIQLTTWPRDGYSVGQTVDIFRRGRVTAYARVVDADPERRIIWIQELHLVL